MNPKEKNLLVDEIDILNSNKVINNNVSTPIILKKYISKNNLKDIKDFFYYQSINNPIFLKKILSSYQEFTELRK